MKVRPILWFWLFAALVVFAGSVKAETIALQSRAPTYAWAVGNAPYMYSSAQSACDARGAEYPSNFAPWTLVVNTPGGAGGGYISCMAEGGGRPYAGWGVGVGEGTTCGGTSGDAKVYPDGATGLCLNVCPTTGGWSKVGNQCERPDCQTNWTRDQATGQCMPPSCPAAGNSAMVGGAAAWKISGGSAACIAGFSYSGCAVKCSSGASSGGAAACTGCTFTGSPGDASSPTGTPVPPEQKTNPTTPEGCLSSGQGYITGSSGITTCIAGKDAPAATPVQTVEKTKTTTTNEAGQTSTTEGTKTTECSGGNCTETTSSTGPNGTTTTQSEKPSESYCQQNPTSQQCKPTQDECEKNPEKIGCKELGTPEDGDALPTDTRGVTSVTVQSFGSSASCPADVNLPKGAKLSYAYPCQMATTLRPLLLALAWLAAGFIVMGAFRDA